MSDKINSVAVLGAGTMGAGIAALAADQGCKVLLLDITNEAAEKGKNAMTADRNPLLSDITKIDNVKIGNFNDNFKDINEYDWICEVVVEKLDIKRQIFENIEKYRKEGSVVSSNTSGIPLRDITHNMEDRLLKDVCITHFFNPVKVMKLCEVVPGEKTSAINLNKLKVFISDVLAKGVVNAKDTVNFIGNRIGCYWMLRGLYEGKNARESGITQETVDALMSRPMGLPPTGLYGLIDLIGLDVMYSVGKNLSINLPANDDGLKYVDLPEEEQKLYDAGQLGRKTGGGFYRIQKLESGEKLKEVYDLANSNWREAKKINLEKDINVLLEDSIYGQYSWSVMGSTLMYAADLIPEIADDIVNVDRAMKWGFAWAKGPFEIIDELGPYKCIEKCKQLGRVPRMLKILEDSGEKNFYNNDGEFMDISGTYKKITD